MQNPFRDGGLLDVAMGWLSLLISIALLWKGIQMTQNGSSWWWPLTAGVMVALTLHGLYRRRRTKRQSSL
jgi:glucose dehydrogenase